MNTETGLKLLPILGNIAEKLDLDKYRVKSNNPEAAGKKFIIDIMKNSSKIQYEIIQAVSILENRSQEEIKKQSFFKTLASFKSIFDNEEFKIFFK